ncbi:hypothetical protein C1T17_12330 [Sphingobium sp. SCG-1]|uniref:hypothetical protein n=1 Tax=Sphingobium sp. SCG-1 TaxID=2072936 RepID=UPI000CD67B43|nr:hypothetical protein [Sphingobium sp. SCG-1]AUW58764.1 hypothetical protein C1T17_12330 [Sphingobium sp. SCG-1]
MAKRPFKVFRTSTGFQDAYVAVTSRKAALEAWGTDKDLFSAGAAELVTDPELIKAPLAQPGVVIRIARGTAAQHLAAAGDACKPVTGKAHARPRWQAKTQSAAAPRPKKHPPRPSRTMLDRAEAALERKEQDYSSAIVDIEARIEDLRWKRDELRSRRNSEIAKLKERRSREEEAYRNALDAWEG